MFQIAMNCMAYIFSSCELRRYTKKILYGIHVQNIFFSLISTIINHAKPTLHLFSSSLYSELRNETKLHNKTMYHCLSLNSFYSIIYFVCYVSVLFFVFENHLFYRNDIVLILILHSVHIL